MENVQTMSDFMAQIQHRIDELKAEAKAQQSALAQELNERLTQSEAMQTQLQQSQQQVIRAIGIWHGGVGGVGARAAIGFECRIVGI